MKSMSVLRTTFVTALLAACATVQPSQPVRTPLTGATWEGTFSSVAADRAGRIHVNVADERSAQVLMIASEWFRQGTRYWSESDMTQQPEMLTARVERTGAKLVKFTLSSYRDVISGRNVVIVFTGLLSGDVIDGSFVARSLTGEIVFEGEWTTQRIAVD